MICFDMDGVLAVYDWDAYKGDNPRYLEKGYFQTCEPDEKAIRLIRYCMKMLPLDTFIVTSVRQDYRSQMVLDKLMWITKHIPEFDIGTRFVANSSMDKSALFEYLRMGGLSRKDILIDDYNPRLYNWDMRGGTAVKWLNGINNANSWYGVSIDTAPSFMSEERTFGILIEASRCK